LVKNNKSVKMSHNMSTADSLEKGYSIASWKDNPWSPEGKERYETALKEFSILLDHPWF